MKNAEATARAHAQHVNLERGGRAAGDEAFRGQACVSGTAAACFAAAGAIFTCFSAAS
jgi:hypothetical protein